MQIDDLFYKWVPVWLRLIILFILVFIVLVANGIYSGNIPQMSGSTGLYAENFSAAYNAMYIGMGLGLMVHPRIKLRFPGKALLLFGFGTMLLMNMVCATSVSPVVIVGASFVIGFCKISALVEVYIIWLVIWSKELDTHRLYPFIYATAISGLYAVTWTMNKLADAFDWQLAYNVIYAALLFSIFLTFVFVEYHPLKKKIPLYLVDWLGLILLCTFLMLVNYIVVFGKAEDWFESENIKFTSMACICTLVIFIRRESLFKRPLFPLGLFSRSTFRSGVLYFILMGIFIPATFQNAFTTGTLQYGLAMNAELGLYMVPGIITGAIISYLWYRKKLDSMPLIATGFAAFVVHHYLLYISFSDQFSLADFWLPQLFQGLGLSILYISVGLYITARLKLEEVFTVAGVAILVRSFLGSGTFASLFSYALYREHLKHFEILAAAADTQGDLFNVHSDVNALYATLEQQATLSASKDLSGLIVMAGLLIVFILVIKYLYQRINHAPSEFLKTE